METNKNYNNNVFQNDYIISNKEEIKKDEDVQKSNINNINLNKKEKLIKFLNFNM